MTTTLIRTMSDEEKRTQAAVLCLQGHTQEEIGARLGVARNTVSTWLSGLREEWVRNAAREFARAGREGAASAGLAGATGTRARCIGAAPDFTAAAL